MLDGFLVHGKQAGFLPGFLCHPLRFSLALARLLQDCVQTYYKDILQRHTTKTYYKDILLEEDDENTYYKNVLQRRCRQPQLFLFRAAS